MSPLFITSPLLEGLPGIRHGFFTRHGGVSTGVYQSLNVGRGSRDRPEDVDENRGRVARALSAATLNTAYQVHSDRVATVERDFDGAPPEADGVVTATAGVLCGALSADCAPILVADAEARVVGAIHAGWKGALSGVVEAGVAALVALGARRDRMTAAIGPCIGPGSYEVGDEFVERFMREEAENSRFFPAAENPGKSMFDLPAFVLSRLRRAGVAASEWVGADTASDKDFFSNRRAFKLGEPDYGRLASAIVLER